MKRDTGDERRGGGGGREDDSLKEEEKNEKFKSKQKKLNLHSDRIELFLSGRSCQRSDKGWGGGGWTGVLKGVLSVV